MYYRTLFLAICLLHGGIQNLTFCQTVVKSVSVDQCSGEHYTETAVVRKDSSLHFIQSGLSFIPLYFWETDFNYTEYLNNLPFCSKALNDTIRDTVFIPKLIVVNIISNPPMSWYEECGEKANGKITDYYYHGKPRMIGTFKNGEPTDTVFKFYYDGKLHSWIYSVNRTYSTQEFFENGRLKRSFTNSGNLRESTYYPLGLLKEERYVKKLGGLQLRQYDANGKLVYSQKTNKAFSFSEHGKLSSTVKRKGATKFLESRQRLNDILYSSNRHIWTIFNSAEEKICQIKYDDYSREIGFTPWKGNALTFNQFKSANLTTTKGEKYKLEKIFINTETYKGLILQLYKKINHKWIAEKEVSTLDLVSCIEGLIGTSLSSPPL